MRLHTTLFTDEIQRALSAAQEHEHVGYDVTFVKYEPGGSRKRARAYEIQLGSFAPTQRRRRKNSGQRGASDEYAAAYDEWGWFIANVFQLDPLAVFGLYDGVDDFNRRTDWKYVLPERTFQPADLDDGHGHWVNTLHP